jgi:hypothetical protein
MAALGGFVLTCYNLCASQIHWRRVHCNRSHVIDYGVMLDCMALCAMGFRIVGTTMLRTVGDSDAAR